MTITRPTFPTNNVTSKGVTPTVDGSAMLEAVDKIGVDVKAYLESLATELESTTAGNDIGVVATGVVANKLNAALTELQGNIVSASTGQIPNNSLSELKMATDMKKQAGGVAPFDTVTTLASNLTNLTTKTDGMEEELDIMRTAKDSTGATNAYILDTPATFDFAVDGNLVHFNPSFTNTGSATLNIDGTTKNIKKFDIDTDTYVDLEAEDIKKFNSIQLRYDVSEGSFVLAPKNGGAFANVKSLQMIYDKTVSGLVGNVTLNHSVEVSNSIIVPLGATDTNQARTDLCIYDFTDSNTVSLTRQNDAGTNVVSFMVMEFEPGSVKNKYTGSFAATGTSTIKTIPAINLDKHMIIVTSNSTDTSTLAKEYRKTYFMGTNTQLWARTNATNHSAITWGYQVIEFK